jgi:hypothetical protein
MTDLMLDILRIGGCLLVGISLGAIVVASVYGRRCWS